ncbi:MAG: transcription termination/antitermination NusG family protein, partial [Chloroflexi bacterium]|nr:transcription termination/antitermination NusG family protein [Chloroflexota bacterium]
MKEWYIAKSEINREGWLVSSLTSLGAEVYYPYIRVKRRGRTVSEPLLPTYVFCRIEVNSGDWWSSLHSPGLDCFLGENGRPTSLSEEVIRQIRIRVEEKNSGSTTPEKNNPQEGDDKDQLNGLGRVFKTGANARQRCRAFFQAIGSLAPIDV